MDQGINRAADHQRRRPATHLAQTAKQGAPKQNLLQHRDDHRGERSSRTGFHQTTGGEVRIQLARADGQPKGGDGRQRAKTQRKAARQFAPLAGRFDQAEVTRSAQAKSA